MLEKFIGHLLTCLRKGAFVESLSIWCQVASDSVFYEVTNFDVNAAMLPICDRGENKGDKALKRKLIIAGEISIVVFELIGNIFGDKRAKFILGRIELARYLQGAFPYVNLLNCCYIIKLQRL